MGRRLLRTSLETLVTVFLASLILFALIRLAPGDPAKLLLGATLEVTIDAAAYDERLGELREQMGLTESLPSQYMAWMGRLLQLDLGTSFYTGRPVADEIGGRLPATLGLAVAALCIQVSLGLVIGTAAALRAGSPWDSLIRLLCVTIASIPGFVIGLLLLSLFAVSWGIYEISSEASLSRLWLPALAMGLLGAPQMIRVVRANMLSEFGQTYMLAALSRGLERRRVIGHALRNALLPVMTLIGLSLTAYIGGAVVIESIFSWPGLGEYALDSILRRDYPVLQGFALVTVLLVVLIHLIVDAAYALLDPRVSRGKGRTAADE